VCVYLCVERQFIYIGSPHYIYAGVSVRVMYVCEFRVLVNKRRVNYIFITTMILHHTYPSLHHHHHQFILATGKSGPRLSQFHTNFIKSPHTLDECVSLGNVRLKNASLFHSFLPLTWHPLLHAQPPLKITPRRYIWKFTHPPPPFICIGEKNERDRCAILFRSYKMWQSAYVLTWPIVNTVYNITTLYVYDWKYEWM